MTKHTIGRREALIDIGLVGFSSLIASCTKLKPTPTIEPSTTVPPKEITPSFTPPPEATLYVRPKPEKVYESGDWSAEIYKVDTVVDVTSKTTQEYRDNLLGSGPGVFSVGLASELSYSNFIDTGLGIVKSTKEQDSWGYVYHDRDTDKVFAGFAKYGHEWELLSWSDSFYKGPHNFSISRNGRVVYNVDGSDNGENNKTAIILTDIQGETKTVYRIKEGSIIGQAMLSDNGEYIALTSRTILDSNPYDLDINVIRIRDGKLIGKVHEESSQLEMVSDDGKGILIQSFINKMATITNTVSGKHEKNFSCSTYQPFGYTISPDFNRLALLIGMFPASSAVQGQWGISVQNGDSNQILSLSNISLIPLSIDNRGMITAADGLGNFYQFKPDQHDQYKEINILNKPGTTLFFNTNK